jgi:serine/threonine protein kinase
MARWNHENIVRVYYAGQEDGVNYLVMEYVQGTDLKAWLSPYSKDSLPAPTEEVLRIGKGVANALDYAHAHDIVHRDVKPSNILLAEDGRILLSDFGLALDIQEGSSGDAFGSPKYIAPEQARGSEDGVPQTDLYSLGVILYEMLTGSLPFQGGSATALAVQHLNQAPPLPRTINPDLNEATEKVLLKSLHKSPRNRYQSGEKLMAALENALNDEAIPAVKPKPFSTVPVADKVAAHLASPNPPGSASDTHSPPKSASSPFNQPGTKNILPILGIGAVGLVVCIAALFIGSLLFNRITQGDAQNNPQTGIGSSGEQNQEQLSQQGSSENGQGEETQVDAPAPTVTLPGDAPVGERLILFYNAGGFYAWNPGNRNITIRSFTFEAVDNDGNSTGLFFDGRRWSGYYPSIQVGKCDRLEILNEVPKERPGQCQGYNAIMTPEEEDSMIFWIPRENINQFRVSKDGQELGLCNIPDGQCEVAIP